MTQPMSYRLRRRLAPLARLLAPGYGCCQHCRMPWKFVQGHIVNYRPDRGVFVVCEDCWPLVTPQQVFLHAIAATEDWEDQDRARAAVNATRIARSTEEDR